MAKRRFSGVSVVVTLVAAAVVVVGFSWNLIQHKANTIQTAPQQKPTIVHKPIQTDHYVFPHTIRKATHLNSILILVNPWNTLSSTYVPSDLVRLPIPFLNPGDPENHMMRAVAVPAFMRLYNAAQKDGIYFAGVSAFRSYGTQAWIYNNNIQTEGLKLTELYSAKPGTSDHQTGLAIDLSGTTGQYATLPQFANTPEGKWLAANAYKYGFIIRYPKGMKKITGYDYEPWHVRYVGVEVAKVIAEHQWTLEQYLQFNHIDQ